MRRTEPEVRSSLDKILESLPALAEPEAGVIDTANVLVDLAHAWPERLSKDRHRSLEALCRKIHVARQVLAVYRPGWKRRKSAEPLLAAFWPLLTGVFLAYAIPAGGEDADRGQALKNLNAALAALDLAPASERVRGLGELRTWSERLLAAVDREDRP